MEPGLEVKIPAKEIRTDWNEMDSKEWIDFHHLSSCLGGLKEEELVDL